MYLSIYLSIYLSQVSTQVTLTLIALEPGIQKVSGLQLFDTVSEQLHEVGPLADVFITQRDMACEVLK